MSSEQRVPEPKLRFPKYRGAGDWSLVPMKRLAKRGKRRNRDEKITRVLTNSAELGVVDQRDYFDREIATQGRLESYLVVELGDYVYNPRISAKAPVGPISKNTIGTGVMSPLYTVFTFNDPENDFFQHFFRTTGWYAYMRQASSTGARHDRMAIGSEDFMAMPVPVSSKSEQQKIADCFSSLAELITSQARKVDALRTYKRALMQQLFPCGGETQPRLRFPLFFKKIEWTPSTLGEYFGSIRNRLVGTATPYYTTSEGVLYLQGRNVKAGKIVADSPIFVTNEFHARQKKSQLKLDDILMVQSGHVGECGVVSNRFVDHNCHALIILTPSQKLSSEFFFQYFYSPIGQESIFQITTGNTIKHILSSDLKTLPVLIPDYDEQQRIANCLSAVDSVIAAAAQQLDTFETHKKGLMQQLFPSVEALDA